MTAATPPGNRPTPPDDPTQHGQRQMDVTGPLGEGGFGQVYRVHQSHLNRDVAVKVMRRSLDSPELREQFVQEARALGTVGDHPHIVTVHDLGFTTDHEPYLVMELCELGSLTDRIELVGPLSAPGVLALAHALGSAVAHAHAHGVVHRDIKPSNVLFDGQGQPKLADFGLAVLRSPEGDDTHPVHMFSRDWAPPEAKDVVDLGERGDVYALAGTLWYALVGTPPREVPPRRKLPVNWARAARRPPLWMLRRCKSLPTYVERRQLALAISHALHPDPTRRTPTVRAFLADLQTTPSFWRSLAMTLFVAAIMITSILAWLRVDPLNMMTQQPSWTVPTHYRTPGPLSSLESSPMESSKPLVGRSCVGMDLYGYCLDPLCFEQAPHGDRLPAPVACSHAHRSEAFSSGPLPRVDAAAGDAGQLTHQFCTVSTMLVRTTDLSRDVADWSITVVRQVDRSRGQAAFVCVATAPRPVTGATFTS